MDTQATSGIEKILKELDVYPGDMKDAVIAIEGEVHKYLIRRRKRMIEKQKLLTTED